MASLVYKITINKAEKVFGGTRKLAAALDISTQAVYDWRKRNLKYVPDRSATKIADLKPELFERKSA